MAVLGQGVVLMIAGMGIVFFFLMILVKIQKLFRKLSYELILEIRTGNRLKQISVKAFLGIKGLIIAACIGGKGDDP